MSQPADLLNRGPEHALQTPRDDHAQPASGGLRRMLSGTLLVLGGALVGQVSSFVFNAAGAHFLGPSRYGALAASMALLSLAMPLLSAVQAVASREATSLAARNEQVRIKPMLRYYGTRLTACALAVGVLVAIVGKWIAGVFHLGSPWLSVIIGAAIPCYMISHLLGGALQGLERFGRLALESIVEGPVKAVLGVIAMAVLWRSALSGMVAVAVSCAAGFMTYLVLIVPVLCSLAPRTGGQSLVAVPAPRTGHRRRPRRGARGVVGYSLAALATYGLLAVMLSSDTLIAKHYLSNYQAGLYAGISLTGKISYFAASSFFVVAFPLFSRYHDQGTSSRRWILAAGAVVAVITGAIVLPFAYEPSWVVVPLLGSRYRAADGYVSWMAAIFGLYALGYLLCLYLLARKRRGVIGVLIIALLVQFAGLFAFHANIHSIMSVLAITFAVLLTGAMLLVALGQCRSRGPRGRQHAAAGRRRPLAEPPAGQGTKIRSARTRSAVRHAGQPANARGDRIATEIWKRVGPAPVLLAGSRAIGTARDDSDYDVAVVLPLLRIPRAADRLAETAQCLSAEFGTGVSINPVPHFRLRHPRGSLFACKLRAEAVVLAAPPGWLLNRRPLTGVTNFAVASALLTATQILLDAFDTSVMRSKRAPAHADRALHKAALHVAQVRLLRSGGYAHDLPAALAALSSASVTSVGHEPPAALSAALAAGLAAPNPIDGFLRVRKCVLEQMAEISHAPLAMPLGRTLVRNAQYAVLATMRGHRRWGVAVRRASVESALAAAQLALLRALDPAAADGVDAGQLRRAIEALPAALVPSGARTWERVRDVALAEWPDAHPLVGLLA